MSGALETIRSTVFFGSHGVGQDYYLPATFAEGEGVEAQAALEAQDAYC
jgi:hypothetical protein